MSIRINRQNYEAFYLDYLEGNLDGELTAELFLFLENNPELKSDLEDNELIRLEPDAEITFDKSSLTQHFNERNIEQFIIANLENEMAAEDVEDLNAYLAKSPEAKILAKRYAKTILPKPTFTYPDKHKLKRRSATLYYLIPAISTAAVVLIYLLINPNAGQDDLPVVLNPNGGLDSTLVEQRNEQEVAKSFESAIEESEQPKDIAVNKNKNEEAATAANTSPQVRNVPERPQPQEPAINIEFKKEPLELPLPPIESAIVNENNAQQKKQPQKTAPVEVIVENNPNSRIDSLLQRERPGKVNIEDIKTAIVENQLEEEFDPEENAEVVAEAATVANSNEALNIGQLVNRGVRKNVLKEESPTTEKIQGNELIAAAAETIDKRVKRKVSYKYKKEKKSRSFALSVGSFEFSRTKNN